MFKIISLLAGHINNRRNLKVAITFNRQLARRQWKAALRGSPSWKHSRQAGRSYGFRQWLGHTPNFAETAQG